MKNGIGNWLDCADVISVSQISRSERATTRSVGAPRTLLEPNVPTHYSQPMEPHHSPLPRRGRCRTARADKRKRKQASDACRPR